MRGQPVANPDDIDVMTLWDAIRRSLKKLVLASLVLGALTFAVLSLMAPRYDSEAELAIVARNTVDPTADPKREAQSPETLATRMDKEAINTHVRALMSTDLAARIVADLKLNERPEFNSALGSVDTVSRLLRLAGIGGPRPGETEQDRVLGAFFKRLEVYPAKESRVIGVRFTSNDADLAADVANRLSEAYREALAARTVIETDDVQKALEPKIAALEKEVEEADAAVSRFRGEFDLFKGGQQSTVLNEQQLQELTAEVSRAKSARSDAESRMKSAHELLQSGNAEAVPDVQKSPLIQNLVQQRVRVERQISELSATLLPGHPRMRQLNADLAGLKRQITSEVAKVVEGIEKEAKVAALREESVTKNLDAVKARVVTTGPDEAKLRALEATARSKRAELDRLQAQFEANRARADSKSVPVEAQIITKARPSSVPSFPKKAPFAALVIAATLLFGTALTVTKALITGARGGGDERTRAVAGALAPSATAARMAAARAAAEPHVVPRAIVPEPEIRSEASPAASRIGTIGGLATHLVSKVSGHSGFRTILAGESLTLDPATEALELARSLAGKGSGVILIEWQPGSGTLADSLGQASHPGFGDLVDGTASFEDVIRKVPMSTAHFMPQGTQVEGLSGDDAERINLILDALDEAYDHIIVTARHEAARELFEAIQGRFDAGVLITEGKRRTSVLDDPPGTFLGFEVADIDLVTIERPSGGNLPAQRLKRATGGLSATA